MVWSQEGFEGLGNVWAGVKRGIQLFDSRSFPGRVFVCFMQS